jgi:hypothetical protein
LLAEARLPGDAAVNLAPHRLADDAHRRAGELFIGLEEASGGKFPVAGVEPRVGAADDAGRPVAAIRHHRHAGTALRRHGGDPADLRHDGCGIGLGELRHPAATAASSAWRPLARHHHQQIGAEAGDLHLDRLRGAVTERDHGDHRTDADDDAEDGEEGAQHVAPDRAQGQHEDAEQHQAISVSAMASGAAVAGCGLAASPAMRPSTKCTMRRA